MWYKHSTHCLPFLKKLNLVSWIRKLMKVSVDLSVNVNDKQSIQHTIYICIHTLSVVDTYIQVFHHNCRWIHILPHLILHENLDLLWHNFDNINSFKNHAYFVKHLLAASKSKTHSHKSKFRGSIVLTWDDICVIVCICGEFDPRSFHPNDLSSYRRHFRIVAKLLSS